MPNFIAATFGNQPGNGKREANRAFY